MKESSRREGAEGRGREKDGNSIKFNEFNEMTQSINSIQSVVSQVKSQVLSISTESGTGTELDGTA